MNIMPYNLQYTWNGYIIWKTQITIMNQQEKENWYRAIIRNVISDWKFSHKEKPRLKGLS